MNELNRGKKRDGYQVLYNSFVDGKARFFGPTAACILFSLRRYDFGSKDIFPSETTIADHWNISERTVIRLLKKLERLNVISISKEVRVSGKWPKNHYQIMPESSWRLPNDVQSHGLRIERSTPSDNMSENRMTSGHPMHSGMNITISHDKMSQVRHETSELAKRKSL